MLVPIEKIENRIFQFRGKKVMVDADLAELYMVPTKRLNEQVKRNMRRFPEDFMFQLTKEEVITLQSRVLDSRSQIATLKQGQNIKYFPYVFTEQGVAMLSSVLNSERAILVNIQIMRAFVGLRRVGLTYAGLKHKIEDMEKKYDKQFGIVFKAIKKLMEPPPAKPKPKIGFHP
ncbi:MAG: ORF6N domain-containing protein [Candidatus Omnitrophota bacterium]